YPAEVFEGTDEEFAARRADYIRAERAAHPEKNPGQLNKEFDRLVAVRAARAHMDGRASHCGAGRVTYIAADVEDREAVQASIGQILAAEGKIDLLVTAPGIKRAAPLPRKNLYD